MRRRLAIFLIVVQLVLLLVNGFVYFTWVDFGGNPDPPGDSRLGGGVVVVLLAVSFVAASLAVQRSSHWLVRLFHAISAAWAGMASYCFLAACACWAVCASLVLGGVRTDRRELAEAFFSLALAPSLYGTIKAALPRVKRIRIDLPHRPASWLGRVAALVTHTHLGPLRNLRFAERIEGKLADPRRFRSILRRAGLARDKPSILLSHAPRRLRIAEAEGISLQLSGHTHGGQIFPFRWMTRRIYGPYTYGLQRLGNMATYTSSGAGPWGPPLRVGTKPEIVLIRFRSAGPG